MHLHPPQADVVAAIHAEHAAGRKAVLGVAPTGFGKTVMMGSVFSTHDGCSLGIAHRLQLLWQMSLALGRFGLQHRILGQDVLVKQIVGLQMRRLGRSFYNPQARVGIAGVDALTRKAGSTDPWLKQVTLYQTDEAHHCLTENKWGRAIQLLPNAIGVGWTATPARADGNGLGSSSDGIFDSMVVGPDLRWVIDNGYLTDYRVFCPQSDIDLHEVNITATGDFSPAPLAKAVHESHIVGDVVEWYLKLARGKLGLTFAVDVAHAVEIATAYRAAGVPAEVITGDTDPSVRATIFARFERRDLMQIVSVDILGEGTDVPAVEVVSMARPTASFVLYSQQFGRMLRLLIADFLMNTWGDFTTSQRLAFIAASPKPHGLLIDHVGNTLRHNGPPDRPREWTLARRPRGTRYVTGGPIPVRVCVTWGGVIGCSQPYERTLKVCPYCKAPAPPPGGRDRPELVDGDLVELDPKTLKAMMGEADKVMGAPSPPYGVAAHVVRAYHANFVERQRAQQTLRKQIALYGGWREKLGETMSEAQRRFYFTFGTDVLTAMAMPVKDAAELEAKILAVLIGANVYEVDATLPPA